MVVAKSGCWNRKKLAMVKMVKLMPMTVMMKKQMAMMMVMGMLMELAARCVLPPQEASAFSALSPAPLLPTMLSSQSELQSKSTVEKLCTVQITTQNAIERRRMHNIAYCKYIQVNAHLLAKVILFYCNAIICILLKNMQKF